MQELILDITDSDGNTCLHRVVYEYCGKHVIEAIIAHDADVNAVNNRGATALMIACETGQKGVCKCTSESRSRHIYL